MDDPVRVTKTRELIEYLAHRVLPPMTHEQFIETTTAATIGIPVAVPPRPRGEAEWSIERQRTIERMFEVGMPIPDPTTIQYAIDDLVYKLNEAREKLGLFGAWLDGEEPE
jgi:hypothetical protein